ncbi:hypothetical protein H8356DRAFT_1707192 [Neocallimastix lanati (nom. inval.)]|jgi:hypothetical protein|uniref:CBM10 domain-containing protein n=1 Tax=Neocallimastix californiae TaxID=1754190 RepID=A0A1Y2FPH1_9FUNG|nr:hypothetical protein H8356DRAFT_1707192 [Neocallimastix sp. JGI-2020a]ORY84615.1 hypothetical protein LY90DRAFT_448531 [Neocallimastix californiae]|eukprot:ORY84615.1 hypothetical protein LY90DRAFT_448531 [Neocallimastix californiae]
MKNFNIPFFLSLISLVYTKESSTEKYHVCKNCSVAAYQNDIYWGFENNQWCEISSECLNKEKECHSYPLYPCCADCNVVAETEDGEWGVENGQWCGIKETCNNVEADTETEEDSEFDDDENVRIVENGIVYPNDPYLYYVGRWNNNNITQWAGSGFKFDFSGTSFTFVSGEKSYPLVEIGYSIDYQEMQYKNITIGENVIVSDLKDTDHNIQMYVTNVQYSFIQMDKIIVDNNSKIHKYEPLETYVQVIGDSLSAGQYCPNEALDAWAFLLGKAMNVEVDVIAKPGACLTDVPIYDNAHGLEYSYFMTNGPNAEQFGYDDDAEYDFSKRKAPELIIIYMGNNDSGKEDPIAPEDYFETLKKFITRIRGIYPNSKIIVTSAFDSRPHWDTVQEHIPEYFDDLYYIPTYEFGLIEAPYVYPQNYHYTQLGNCLFLKNIIEKISEVIGMEPQPEPTNKWGMHDNVVTGYEVCDNPLDDSVVYHYDWENFGGIGAW